MPLFMTEASHERRTNISSRTYAVGVPVGVRGPQAPENLLFLALVGGKAAHQRQKAGALVGEALQTSQLGNS